MVPFDAESLFPNITIEGAVQAVLWKLENDPTLADHTTLTPAQIVDLLDFIMTSPYFQYNGSIYKHPDSTAMCSSRKYLYPPTPHGRDWIFQGEGEFSLPNFPVGRGVIKGIYFQRGYSSPRPLFKIRGQNTSPKRGASKI